jgi:hypothetical protein
VTLTRIPILDQMAPQSPAPTAGQGRILERSDRIERHLQARTDRRQTLDKRAYTADPTKGFGT